MAVKVNAGATGLVDVSLLACILGVLITTVWILRDPKGSKERQEEEMRLIYNTVLTVGALAWPIIFDGTIGLDKLMTDPRLLPGFFWPVALCITELNYVGQFSTATGARGRASALFQHADLNADTSAIISAAFAMGSLMMNKSNTYNTSHIIMYALVFCLAFVVPTLQVPPETRESVMFRSAQKVITTYAIGFIVCGISSDLFSSFFSSTSLPRPPGEGTGAASASASPQPTSTPTPAAPTPTPTPAAPTPTPAPAPAPASAPASREIQGGIVFRDLNTAL
jgi:hypothetical protein